MKKFLILILALVALNSYGQGFIGNSATSPDELYSVDPSCDPTGVIVGVGLDNPSVRLHVRQGGAVDAFATGTLINNAGITSGEVTILGTGNGGSGGDNVGVLGYTNETGGTNTGVAGMSQSSGSSTAINTGVFGGAQGDNNSGTGVNVGVTGYANGAATGGTITNKGLEGDASGMSGGTNYGCYAQALNTGGTSYGVYGTITGTSSAGTHYALYGDAGSGSNYHAIYANGQAGGTTAWTNYSDIKIKDNVQNITNALDVIMQLSPKSYTFKREEFPSMALPAGKNYGLIAQEVEKILPTLVKNVTHPEKRDKQGNLIYDKIELKTMDYTSLIPFLIQGMKEQQAVIEKLTSALEAIKKSGGVKDIANGNIDLGSTPLKDRAQLFQNNPNPFSESTEIKYFLPQSTEQAFLNIYDMQGKQLKSLPIQERGDGKISIKSTELGVGMYFYSLIANGKEVDTKRMILIE